MIFWLNGEFSTNPDVINIADRGFLLGDGVFETILVVNGVPAFWDAHLSRLRAAAAALFLDAEFDHSILGVIPELVARNRLTEGLASLRITLSRGPGRRGLQISSESPAKSTFLATVSKHQTPKEPEPLKLIVSSLVRCEASLSSRYKTVNYLDNVMARHEAASRGSDDALMLNSAGRVACVSAGNIFQIAGDTAVTPAVSEGALNGIVRRILLEGGAETGLMIKEGAIERSSLTRDRLFVTNSLFGVRRAVFSEAATSSRAPVDKSLNRLQSWYESALEKDLKRRAGDL